jgi:hypothetical protein
MYVRACVVCFFKNALQGQTVVDRGKGDYGKLDERLGERLGER